MKTFGSSMLLILKSGTLLTFRRQESYVVGNIVFCQVKGRYIDAHKIVAKDATKGYLIANNHSYNYVMRP
jgi:SOS-response transcriptional repressor LexA